jgi:ergothioneine biosynthesis protein EgtB
MRAAGAPVMSESPLRQLEDARAKTDELFRVVRPEALFDRPIAERHRIIFYVGHLEAFDWNLIWKGAFEREPFHEELDRLFAFGIDPVDGALPCDQPGDWPSIAEVGQYCLRVRSMLDTCLEHGAAPTRHREECADGTLIQVAIEHRLMHAETLAYMLHQLPYARKVPQPQSPAPAVGRVVPHMVAVPPGQATLGRSRSGGFGWDNEFDEHSVHVPAFDIDACKVTNGQFLEFVRAGGYEDRSVWREEDWTWKEAQGIRHPVFWEPAGDRFEYRAAFERIPMPHDWPVYVSHAEARAYARWAGKSLPTEAQWHRAAYGTASGSERLYPWGSDEPQAHDGNFDFRRWDPVPENEHPSGRTAFGVDGMVGNGWEWTDTVFRPFPGFQPFPFYPGYSANFFDGGHYVMKGGSARTAACLLRRSFRNWFQPHYQYVYAGFRCVSGS